MASLPRSEDRRQGESPQNFSQFYIVPAGITYPSQDFLRRYPRSFFHPKNQQRRMAIVEALLKPYRGGRG